MSLRFLVGPAGSGKTHRCLDEITRELAGEGWDSGPPLYLLVPEQATFQMERALLTFHSQVRATARARVLSFKRLAYLALAEAGGPGGRSLGELGRLLALSVVLSRRREALSVLGEAAGTEGFVEAAAAILSELQAYGHSPESLAGAARVVSHDAQLCAKLEELAGVFAEYRKFLGRRFYDADALFAAARRALRDSPLMKGARVWIDGFAGFTPQEYDLLGAILEAADRVTVALCVDPETADATGWSEGPSDGLFHPVLETLVHLRERAEEAGVPIEPPVLLAPGEAGGPRFCSAPLLGRLERLIARDPDALWGSPAPGGERVAVGGPAAIRVVEAPDPRREVEEAARQILRWVRDEGRSFSSIGVVLRDLEPYRELIETTFPAWGIPYFLDSKEAAYHHPAASLLRAALEVASGGFAGEGVPRFLKSGLAPVDDDVVDRLENAALAYGAPGREWESELPFESEEGLLEAWRAASAPLRALRERWRRLFAPGQAPANEAVEVLEAFLRDVGAEARIQAWIDAALAGGDPLDAREHAQVWSAIVELLEEIAAVMGENPVTAEEFAQAVTLGLKRLRLGRVPPRLDQVLVGSVERSRQPDLECVAILGCNAGRFPAGQREDAIFSDAERDVLAAAGVGLAPGSRLRAFHERYLAYIALTRASRALLLTYSRSDDGGRPLKPSPVVTWLCGSVEGLQVEKVAAAPFDEFPESREGIARWAACTLRAAKDGTCVAADRVRDALSVAAWLRSEGARAFAGSGLRLDPLQALEYQNRSLPLSREEVEALYGPEARFSPTSLEEFASCPFRFFVSRGLGIAERPVRRISPSDLGLLAHAVLRRLVEMIGAEGIDWAELSRERSDELVASAFEEAAKGEVGEAFEASASGRYALRRMKRTLQAVAWAAGALARRGAFRPIAVEVGFGEGMRLPGLALDAGEGRRAFVHGRIDRIDLAEDEKGRRFVRVIDYKSSDRPFRLDALVYGIDLQLGVYAAVAARALEGARFAGCLYLPVLDPVVSRQHPGPGAEEEWFKKLKAAGLIVDAWGVPRLMDREAVGPSPLLPLEFTRDGSLGKRSWVAPPERMEMLVAYAARAAAGLARRVLDGETAIAPYQLSEETPCRNCPYKPVCQFDPLVEGNAYRRLRPMGKEEAWSEIERRLGEEGGTAVAV